MPDAASMGQSRCRRIPSNPATDVTCLSSASYSSQGRAPIPRKNEMTLAMLFDPFARWNTRSWQTFPLRLIVGFGFMQHGYAKLGRGTDNFTQILQALHVPMPMLAAWATILTELIGGAAILLGAFMA